MGYRNISEGSYIYPRCPEGDKFLQNVQQKPSKLCKWGFKVPRYYSDESHTEFVFSWWRAGLGFFT